MKISLLIIAPLLLMVLLVATKFEKANLALGAKSLLSALFVVTAVMLPSSHSHYSTLMVMGLASCFVGDIFLALGSKRTFLIGLGVFLVGHFWYLTAFFQVGQLGLWTGIVALGALVLAVIVYRWLRPHLGSMGKPVVAYIAIISLMIVAASSLIEAHHLSGTFKIQVIGGALLFYLSDLFVARNRFVEKAFVNRAIGLPLYYLGQFALALSVADLS